MDAWKFVDYSGLSPVFALSFTTEQWGLEPFPGNLVAITGYWQDIEGSNNLAEPAWELPYSCPSSDDSTFLYYDYYCTDDDWVVEGYNDIYNSVIYISGSDNICAEPQLCPDSGCLILIEGIGKATTGPANSSVVGLSHGITLLIIAITVAIIMGCGLTKSFFGSPPPPPSRTQLAQKLRPYMNPPPSAQRQQTYAERTAAAASTANEVAQCSALLRQLYALDLAIWSKEDCVDEEIPEREDMMCRANALFAEIHRIVHAWRSRAGTKWSAEEQLHIDEICRFLDQHDLMRYKW
jgi:hypothetical protein